MKKKSKAILNILGTIMVTLVLISVIPVGVPRIFGLKVYNVVSGSMEPAIKVGSAIYVKNVSPTLLDEEDVVAFYVENSVIAHRVVENNLDAQKLITKGDANEANDMLPVSYGQIIGKVVVTIPYLGYCTALYTTTIGKIYLLCFLAAGVLLQILSKKIKNDTDDIFDNEEQLLKILNETSGSDEIIKNAKRNRWIKVIGLLMVVVVIAFAIVAITIFKTMSVYNNEAREYELASELYTNEITEDTAETEDEGTDTSECPITVDFDSLQATNPEIVGWIYCEDTVIDYPVCQNEDDDYYINHGFDKSSKSCGAIFLEAANESDFSDQNNILYGHHMKNGSMFASLSKWGKQDYYEEHPVMWLLTPDKNYKILIFSEYTTSATSDTYAIYRNTLSELKSYIEMALDESNIDSVFDVELDKDSKFIVLSTCAYSYDNARTVVHGMMVEE